MATEAIQGAVGGSNPAPPAPSMPAAPAPANGDARATRREASRAAFLSSGPGSPESPAETPAPPAEDPGKPEPDAEEAPVEEEKDESSAEPTEPELAAAKADSEIQKRLDAIQKAEKKSKAAVEERRKQLDAEYEQKVREFERRQSDIAPKLEAYEKAVARINVDPLGVLEALGWDVNEHGGYLSRLAYGKSKEGAKDPRYKADAERAMREREQAGTSEAALKEVRALREQLEQERRQAAIEREVSEYMDGVKKAVGPDARLTARLLSKSPAKAEARLAQTAHRLFDETGEQPDHADVVAALEAELRELVEDDPPAVVETAKPKTKTLQADETKTAPTLSSDLGTPTKPRTQRLSKEERRRETIAELERGGRA